MAEPVCVNPDLSLLDLIHIQNGYQRKLKDPNLDPALKNDLKAALKDIKLKILDLEDAAKTPGQCIRIM